MELNLSSIAQIICPQPQWQIIVDHCRRKLNGIFREEETKEPKAFGLLAGSQHNEAFMIDRCVPLLKNARFQDPYGQYMDSVMAGHAFPSETPLTKRGWVADPEELLRITKDFSRNRQTLLGSYHMHRVAWEHDAMRDTPTPLDTVLAHGSCLFTFIVSMVAPELPTMRAYYEGLLDKEVPIEFI